MRTVLLSLVAVLAFGCSSSQRSGGGGPVDPTLAAALDALLPGEDAEDAADVALLVGGARAVYKETWSEEGTGIGLAVVIRGGGKDERVEVFMPGDDVEGLAAALAKAKHKIGAHLRGEAVTQLTATPWPTTTVGDEERAAPSTEAAGVTLVWAGTTIEARDASGKRLGVIDWSDEVEPPHVGVPVSVYTAPGLRTLLVSVLFDPSGGYAEGYNVYASTYVLALR